MYILYGLQCRMFPAPRMSVHATALSISLPKVTTILLLTPNIILVLLVFKLHVNGTLKNVA